MKYWSCVVAASLAFAAPFGAAAERDETKATQYLYCGRVAAVNMNIATERGNQRVADGFRQMRTHFLIAATLKSDGEFVKKEIPKVLKKFDEQHLGPEGGAKLFRKETEECSGIWSNEVRSLIGFDKKQDGSENRAQ